jgi:hypothetical protein
MIWTGNSRWVNSMEWSGKEAFVSSSEKPFTVDGKEAGVLKSHGPLSFLKVWPHIKHTIFVPFSQSAVFFLNKINSHLHNVCYLFYVTSLLLKKRIDMVNLSNQSLSQIFSIQNKGKSGN